MKNVSIEVYNNIFNDIVIGKIQVKDDVLMEDLIEKAAGPSIVLQYE